MPQAVSILEEHCTPDGLFRFIVTRSEDGDLSLGFDAYGWHTHGDLLASMSGLSEEEAVRQFVDALLSGRSAMAIARVAGEIRDVWVADPPYKPDPYMPPEETIEFRRWDGGLV